MNVINVKAGGSPIIFEGTQYPDGMYLISDFFVVEEPGGFVVYDQETRLRHEVPAAGVVSEYTAGRLIHNWPEDVTEATLSLGGKKKKKAAKK